jgi:hypothetical protein
VFWIVADNADDPLPLDNLAFIADLFNRRANLHIDSPFVTTLYEPPFQAIIPNHLF